MWLLLVVDTFFISSISSRNKVLFSHVPVPASIITDSSQIWSESITYYLKTMHIQFNCLCLYIHALNESNTGLVITQVCSICVQGVEGNITCSNLHVQFVFAIDHG